MLETRFKSPQISWNIMKYNIFTKYNRDIKNMELMTNLKPLCVLMMLHTLCIYIKRRIDDELQIQLERIIKKLRFLSLTC